MTPQETEQVAALRMHVAHLHNALKGSLEYAQSAPLDSLDEWKAALEQSEPAVKDLLREGDRDAQLLSTRQQLAETTARLATIEAAANAVVTTQYNEPATTDTAEGSDLESAIAALAQALK